MNNKKNDTAVKVLYILAGMFAVIWSVKKYSLGINKNFFFGQLAVIGIIYMFISMFARMQRKLLAQKVEVALEDCEFAKAVVLMDKYIAEEKVPAQTYLGRGFLALLQNDEDAVNNILTEYDKYIENADKEVLKIIIAAISAKEGDTVRANQLIGENNYDFSSLLNKDFYIPLTKDLRDYIDAITAISQDRQSELAKIVKRREKNTLAGAYESIMNLLWDHLKERKIYVLKAYEGEAGYKKGVSKLTQTVILFVLAALVLMVPSDFNFKDEYDSLRQLNERVNFLNKAVCAYGNDEVYYLKYYDSDGNYNDLVFEVNGGKYSVLTGERRFEQFMKGTVDGRDIRISLFGSEGKNSKVIVIEEKTSLAPSESAVYNAKTAFPMSIYSSDEGNYTVFMGLYEGSLQDIVVEFGWGSVDIYDLN